MRIEPTLNWSPRLRRFVLETTPGWSTAELIERFRHYEDGRRRPLAFRHRRVNAPALAA